MRLFNALKFHFPHALIQPSETHFSIDLSSRNTNDGNQVPVFSDIAKDSLSGTIVKDDNVVEILTNIVDRATLDKVSTILCKKGVEEEGGSCFLFVSDTVGSGLAHDSKKCRSRSSERSDLLVFMRAALLCVRVLAQGGNAVFRIGELGSAIFLFHR